MAITNGTFVFLNWVLLVVSMYILQIHAVPLNAKNKQPIIMNAELKVISQRKEPLRFDDLTNNIQNIHPKHPLYDQYVAEHTAQQNFRNVRNYVEYEGIIFSDRAVLHPKSVASIKAGTGPIFALDKVSTGPIDNTHKPKGVFDYFVTVDSLFRTMAQEIIASWDQVTIDEYEFNEHYQQHAIDFHYLKSNGSRASFFLLENQLVYDLVYYKYLQLNAANKETNPKELAAFEAKIKAQTGYQNARDGGVKLCKKEVHNVYCSKIFQFLGPIDSNHPYFEGYEIYYLYERYHDVPEPVLNELPFHQLIYTRPDDFKLATIVDADDNNKKVGPEDRHFETYYALGVAQYKERSTYYQKQLKHEVPMEVFQLPKAEGFVYTLRGNLDYKTKTFKKGDADYTFAARSFKLKKRINRILSKLKENLEAGKVEIEAKIKDLSTTPIFMINNKPEEITFQDLRYELIRYYHLKNLQKGMASP